MHNNACEQFGLSCIGLRSLAATYGKALRKAAGGGVATAHAGFQHSSTLLSSLWISMLSDLCSLMFRSTASGRRAGCELLRTGRCARSAAVAHASSPGAPLRSLLY